MRRATFRLLAVAGYLLAAGTAARAEMISWSYSTLTLPNVVTTDDPGPTGSVHFRSAAAPDVAALVGPTGSAVSHVILANLTTTSSAPASAPAHFDGEQFELAVAILDKASNKSGIAIFHGSITGSLSGTSAHLAITFDDPVQTLHLGHHRYRIKIDSISPPGPPGSALGAIGAEIRVRDNPEPSALILAGVGVAGVGAAGWRRRRANVSIA